MSALDPLRRSGTIEPAGDPAETEEPAAGSASARARTPGSRPIPHNTIPPNHPEYWPHDLRSARLPIRVRYRDGEESIARRVLPLLEKGWAANARLGFRAPPIEPGRDAIDVYLWRGIDESSVAWKADVPATPHADAYTYMVVDPEGSHGGAKLAHLAVHEMNHLFQAADDWFEYASAFEGTATFVEWEAHGLNDEVLAIAKDFQDRPHWSIDRDPGERTWYAYGYAMYLRFLKSRYAEGDARFIGEAWRRARSGPAAENDPARNAPDLVTGLEAALPGLHYVDSVVEFARWRYYTGARADGAHDLDAARLPEVPVARVDLGRAREKRIALEPAPTMLGTSYLELDGRAGETVTVSLRPPRGARFVVQAVPGLEGGTDGETLDLSSGRARLRLGPGGKRTLIVTVVPPPGATYDPDTRKNTKFPATVVIER